MKKIIYLVLVFCVFLFNDVKAISFDVIENNGKKELVVIDDSENTLNYKDAMNEYDLKHYFDLIQGSRVYYFYDGLEISKKEYLNGLYVEEADEYCKSYEDYCIRVNSTEDIINQILKLYYSGKIGEYHLVYPKNIYKKIDFKYIENILKDNSIIVSNNKNMYKYEEYYKSMGFKSMFEYNEDEMIVPFIMQKTTNEEIEKVNLFLEKFIPLFSAKSDYEKILATYLYISNTAEYDSNSYSDFLSGSLSAYDVLINRKYVCVGSSTTFQLIMEKFGIESYIVDINYNNDNMIGSTHTYNLVKLNDIYYVVDITNDLSGFLLGKKIDHNDYYYDVNISDKSYFEVNEDAVRDIKINYRDFDNLIKNIKSDEKKDEVINSKKEEIKDVSDISVIVLILILVVLFIIVVISIRRK